MRRVFVAAHSGTVAPLRVVLMPGALQEPEAFLAAGFADAVRRCGLALDLELIAPELTHLTDRSVLDALATLVVAPARAAGCRELWLGGVSLGGYLALSYAERRGRALDLDGLCLIAPYLGNRLVTGEIAAAGGVRAWQAIDIAAEDDERRVWAFLRGLPVPGLALYLGIGRADRFGAGHALLAQALPAESVEAVDGGHDWSTWQQLWAAFLGRLRARPDRRTLAHGLG